MGSVAFLTYLFMSGYQFLQAKGVVERFVSNYVTVMIVVILNYAIAGRTLSCISVYRKRIRYSKNRKAFKLSYKK